MALDVFETDKIIKYLCQREISSYKIKIIEINRFEENLGVRTVDEVVKVRKWNDLGSKQITTQTADFGKIRLQDLYFACSFHVGIDPKVVGSNLGDVFFFMYLDIFEPQHVSYHDTTISFIIKSV